MNKLFLAFPMLLILMSPLHAVQVIPQQDAWAGLGKGLGEGISEGIRQRLQERSTREEESSAKEGEQLILRVRSLIGDYDYKKTSKYIFSISASELDAEQKQLFIGILMRIEFLEKIKDELDCSNLPELLQKIYVSDLPNKQEIIKDFLNTQELKEILIDNEY